MRTVLRLLLLLVVAVPLALVALLVLAIDDTPLVAGQAGLTPQHVDRARWLLARHDPRAVRPGVLRSIVVSQEDLDIAANYVANRYVRASSRIVLLDGRARWRITFELPSNPVGTYVNVDASLRETAALPQVEQLRVGRVPVPAWVCNWWLERALARLQADGRGAATDVVKSITARDGFLRVDYAWDDATPDRLKAALVGADEQARWQVYQLALVDIAQGFGRRRVVTLDELLVPLLRVAAQRSADGANPVLENRAALIVLAFYVNGKGLAALVPRAREWPVAQRRVVTLAGRTDFPQHFSISAALAATAGSPVSDAVGLYKEIDDSRGGSGFSFNDIAADRAGTRFGALAVENTRSAARLHKAAQAGIAASDLVPDVRDLPEFLSQSEFKRRFGGVGQPAYQAVMADIERRIAALPLYR